jgi:hypothetical protein
MIIIIDILTLILRILPIFLQNWKASLVIQGECSICLDTNNKKMIKTKECGHDFHLECLNKWIKQNPTCPYCRCELKTKVR